MPHTNLLILRSAPKGRVSKDPRWFCTHREMCALTSLKGERIGAGGDSISEAVADLQPEAVLGVLAVAVIAVDVVARIVADRAGVGGLGQQACDRRPARADAGTLQQIKVRLARHGLPA